MLAGLTPSLGAARGLVYGHAATRVGSAEGVSGRFGGRPGGSAATGAA